MAKKVTQREVDSAAASLQNMQRAYGENNMATERAWSNWFRLNETRKKQLAEEKEKKEAKRMAGPSTMNPAVSAQQYGLALAVMSVRAKERTGMSKEVAREIVERTPKGERVKFAKELAKHRRNAKGPVGSTLETFGKAGSYLDQQLGKVVGHNPQQTTYYEPSRVEADEVKRSLEDEGWKVRVEFVPEVKGKPWRVTATKGKSNPDYNFDLYEKAKQADDNLQRELERLYGSRAGDMRYQSGKFTPKLKQLAAKKHKADEVWLKEMRKKDNPEDEAADMYSSFHGKPSESVDEFVEDEHYHGNLAQLGELVELKICTVSGFDCTLSFETLGVQLASNEDGTQMYFVSGDQSLPLSKIHMDGDDYKKDSMVIGEVYFLSYFTEKDFDDFEPIIYEHELGIDEDTKKKLPCPTLRYDCLNEKIYLDGGAYIIKKPMFETSRGIER
jgi:hypothetical protein